MGRFKQFMIESDSPWREDLDLRYLHDHMGTEFLKLLLQYENGKVEDELWDLATSTLEDRLRQAGELENMESVEANNYAQQQLHDVLHDYVSKED